MTGLATPAWSSCSLMPVRDEFVPVAIETAKGLLVASLLASGREVFSIIPLATSRYRDRHRSTRAKSDAADAIVLANILRTDRHAHRPLPNDSELVRSLRVLTRAQEDAVGDRMRMSNRIRAVLKQFFPAAIDAFDHGGKHRLDSPACRAILAAAPTPAGSSRRGSFRGFGCRVAVWRDGTPMGRCPLMSLLHRYPDAAALETRGEGLRREVL
jgi:hypothetical protein